MVAFILPANSVTGGFDIDNSLRIEDGDSPYLQLAHGADGTTKTMTFSWWFKQGNITINRNFFGHSSVDDAIFIRSDDGFSFIMRNAADGILTTNRKFRDPTAWYHIVLAIDTTQGTAANRIKLYVNGVQETSFATATYPDQNTDLTGFNTNTDNQFIGREKGGNYFDGYMAEVYFIDGVAKAPTDFGEVNDNGVWVPIKYSGSYGTNGYFLEFKQTGTSQNSSGIGADTSGNDNHFAVNNLAATDVTVDTPTNNFATLNTLNKASNVTLTEGNCKAAIAGSGQSRAVTSSIAVSSGKWYWEINYTTDVEAGFVGVITADGAWNPSGSDLANNGSDDNVGYISGGNKYINGSASSYGDGWDDGDTISVLLNIDDDEVIFYKNGTAQNSGTAISKTFSGFYYAVVQHTSSSGTSNFSMNFGNPPHSISSGNADADGHGNFEYAVPSGYFALCTKNLAEYG